MSILNNNKTFFIFLAKFGLSYLILSVLYWLYLNQFDAAAMEADSMTRLVTNQTGYVVHFLGEKASMRPRFSIPAYKFFINGKPVATIIEGCNAVSVMILFTAFIVAFSTTFKRTALYIIAGVIIIHILNVMRIGLLCVGIYYYPEYREVLHDIIFPIVIYGVVFVLWVAWVTKFSGNAKKVPVK